MISRFKNIILVGCVIVLVTLIWLLPLQSRSASVRLITDGSCDGRTIEVNIYAAKAYKDLYSFHAVVSDGELTFLLPTEYLPADRIYITDEEFARCVTGMGILSNGLSVADYESASMDGEVWRQTGSEYELNDSAMKTIDDGLSNPWFFKVMLCVGVVALAVLTVVYLWMRKCFGTFRATLSYGIGFTALWLIASWKHDDLFNITLNLAGKAVSNGIPVILIVITVAVLLIACVLCGSNGRFVKPLILVIYVFVLVFSVGKAVFYAEKVGNTPDEETHIAYVAYLEETGEWIPTYESMCMMQVISSDTETLHARFAEGTVNNLRHPPLYYHLIRMSNGITFDEDGTFTVDLDRVRGVSMAIATAALVLILYIGYTRLKKIPLIHLLYGMIVTGVPMMMYGISGVNNDTFTLLTISVFFLGILRFSEKKRSFFTYLLIALGVSLTLLTKMTAGIIVVIAALIVVVVTLIREKCWKELLSWQFLTTLPLYLIVAAFYLYEYAQYGSFQPSLHALNEAYAYSTGFYPPVETRTVQSLMEYIGYFFDRFIQSWWGIASHISLMKPDHYAFLETAALSMLWLFPLLFIPKSIRRNQAYTKSVLALYVGAVVTIVMQFVNGYTGLLERGYLGGFQSRYYLCVIVMFAFSAALMVQKVFVEIPREDRWALVVRRVTVCATVFFIGLLAYEDFIYFLLHYTTYL